MKMMKYFSLFLFILASTASNSVSSEELKFATQDFAPFNYRINGKVSGPAADIIRLVCSRVSVDCSFQLLPWRRAQKEVKDGNSHGLFVIGWNKKRSEWLHYSPPIMKTEYGFFAQDDSNLTYLQASDIAGLKVGVFGPSNTSNSLEKIKNQLIENGLKAISIDMRPNDEDGFKKLRAGRVDAVFSNRDVGYALLKKLNIKNVRYAGAQKKLKYYIGFSMEHTDKNLVEKFNAELKGLYQQGKIQEVITSYQMESVDLE